MLKPLMIAGAVLFTVVAVYAQKVPTATCNGCPASYISNEELQAYLKRAIARNQIDQQVRSVDIGKSGVAVGMVHRTKLDQAQPNSVAEHDHVSEVYHVISGSATELGCGLSSLVRWTMPTATPLLPTSTDRTCWSIWLRAMARLRYACSSSFEI